MPYCGIAVYPSMNPSRVQLRRYAIPGSAHHTDPEVLVDHVYCLHDCVNLFKNHYLKKPLLGLNINIQSLLNRGVLLTRKLHQYFSSASLVLRQAQPWMAQRPNRARMAR